jgi:hypothetical protein
MNKKPTYVIVGASLAGATAAQALREQGFTGRIVLIGQETEQPYERPALSKGYLLGKDERASIYVHEERWYAEHAVELLLGRRATLLDRGAHEVELDTGERIGYTKLLLATGASPRRLRLPGADLDGVHYLRRVEDSDRLREAFRDGGRIVVVGAGWIGLNKFIDPRTDGAVLPILHLNGYKIANPIIFAYHGLPGADSPPGLPPTQPRQPARPRLQRRRHDHTALRHGRAQRPRPVPPRDKRDRPRARSRPARGCRPAMADRPANPAPRIHPRARRRPARGS